MALRSRSPNDVGMSLVNLLLVECACMSERFLPPQHLYSHREGGLLDTVFGDVDRAAEAQALRQPRPIPGRYIEGLQPPPPSLWRDRMQWRNLTTIQDRLLRH